MSRMVTLLIALALSFATPAAFGAIIHVPGDSATIQAGINGAVNGDTVLVADGTYTGDGNRDIDFGGKLIIVRSESGPEFTIIDCGGDSLEDHRAFYFHNGEDSMAVVEGFRIIKDEDLYDSNLSGLSRDAIACDLGSSPTIYNCVFDGNGAGGRGLGGSAIRIDRGSGPKIIRCSFVGNSAANGAAIRAWDGWGIQVDSCQFVGNSSSSGGAIRFDFTYATISNCSFVGNSSGYGGALAAFMVSPTLFNCVFESNSSSGGGGAICLFESSPTMTDCIFSRNTANYGGAVFWEFPTAKAGRTNSVSRSAIGPDFVNCAFYGNVATDSGSAVYSRIMHVGGPSYELAVTFENTIIAFCSGSEAVMSADTEITHTFTCSDVYGNSHGDWVGVIADQAGINGNFSLDPLFCDTASSNYHISSASPCAPTHNSCGVLIGALGMGCATEPIAFIDPDTMYAFQGYSIDTIMAIIYFGDFTDGNSVADINLPTILINGSISPTSWTLLPSHPDFHGEAMEITFPIRDFILGYMPLWDTTIQEYSVSGQFNDNTEFVVSGEVTMIGHTSGDVNGDGRVNVADLTYLIDFLFNGGAEPPVPETADLDHNGAVNVADVTELVRFLFG